MSIDLIAVTPAPPEKPLASPCCNICALDDDDICIGCQRSAAEITRWGRMDNAERRQVLLRCVQRAQANGLFSSPST